MARAIQSQMMFLAIYFIIIIITIISIIIVARWQIDGNIEPDNVGTEEKEGAGDKRSQPTWPETEVQYMAFI